jgi:hypothetical protein
MGFARRVDRGPLSVAFEPKRDVQRLPPGLLLRLGALLELELVEHADEEVAHLLGDRRSARRSECPKPGRSTAMRCALSEKASQSAW